MPWGMAKYIYIYLSTIKIFSNQKEKIHNIWNPIKSYDHREAGRYNPNQDKNQLIKTNAQLTKILELTNKDIKVVTNFAMLSPDSGTLKLN